jgi:tRNA threonylcarbamoyladenosine biosynthesis protein TsaB
MNLLAIDTAVEQCSAALLINGKVWSRTESTARGHADLILPMIQSLLSETGFTLARIDGLAFGRGPGSFTGVRIAIAVIQGLALSRNLSVVGISDLAALAQRAAIRYSLPPSSQVLACIDARMHEVYWAWYGVTDDSLVDLIDGEYVTPPKLVRMGSAKIFYGAGTGWRAYPELQTAATRGRTDADLLPSAIEVSRLALKEFQLGRAVKATEARPVYLRNEVVSKR